MNSKDLFLISLLLFLTVTAWIIAGVYHKSIDSTLTPTDRKLIEPLNPALDKQVILDLKSSYGP
ncbi:hypothetical protein HY439_02570 [Candidatus Microgenomates bacterium]|nr:hypothetical protein [Candidatus Microgenomates bacterium]